MIMIGAIVLVVAPAHAARLFFAVTGADVRSQIYGGNSGTVAEKISEKYVAPEDAILCTIYHNVSRTSAFIVDPSVTLTVSQGGSNPDGGLVIASVRVPAAALPTSINTEVAFTLPSCISIISGRTYWFTFENYAPIYVISFGNYVSGYRASNQFSYSSLWIKNGSAFTTGNVWIENVNAEWSLRLEGPDPPPAPPKKEPVIIVPGILGTRLNHISNGEEVWPNTDLMKKVGPDSYLDALLLDAFGNPTVISAMDPSDILEEEAIPPFPLSVVVYGHLIKAFADSGYASGTELFTVPYDWRLNLASSTSRLDAVIKKAIAQSPNGRVNIIAHSLGGVLVKEYLRQASSTAFVDKLVLVGVPELGSPKAFKALTYGDDFDMNKFGLGLNQDEIKRIAQNMPAVYQLLPSRKYLEKISSYIIDFTNAALQSLTYDQSREFMLRSPDDSRNPVLLGRADEFHGVVDDAGFNMPTSSIYRLSGCQNPKTIGTIRIQPDNDFDLDAIDGDGTVPLKSATYSAVGHDYFALYGQTRIDHMGLVGDDAAVALLRDIVTGTSTPSLPDGISLNKSDCGFIKPRSGNETTIAFSTHSPVLLHIYDAQGQHTGPDANGDIELGIPGSNYERIRENSFAWVPGGDTYKVVAAATDSGSFDLKAKLYSGIELKGVDTYLSVPLASNQTIATATFTDIQHPPALQLDSDGDGVPDSTVNPTAVLADADAADIVPPVIAIVSPETKNYTYAAVIPLTINTTDDQSGTASSLISFDGTLITSSGTLDQALLTVGSHTLSVMTRDRAGNVAAASVGFQVVFDKTSVAADIDRLVSLGSIRPATLADNLKEQLVSMTAEEFLVELRKDHNLCKISDLAYQTLKQDVGLLQNNISAL